MATVRLTQELKGDIQCKARGLFNTRKEHASVFPHMELIYGKIFPTLFGRHKDLVASMPAEWLHDKSGYTITCINGTSVNIPVKERVGLPPCPLVGMHGGFSIEYSVSVTLGVDGNLLPEWQELMQEVTKWQAVKNGILNEEKEFVRQIETLLDSYTTLSPALKAWPQLWDILPESTKTKHKEVAQRTPRAERTAPDIDTDTLSTVLAKSKVLGE